MANEKNRALLKRLMASELTTLKTECAQLSNDVREFVSLCEADLKTQCENLLRLCAETDKERDEAVRLYRVEEARRRDYGNQLQALKGNIRVVCRVRPVNKIDEAKGTTELAVFRTSRESVRCDGKEFIFDEVFGPKHNNSHVFEEALPMVESVFEGFHACIFAYGQTGSGKTFTMSGSPNDRGVNYRAVERLFDMREAMMSTNQYQAISFYVSNVEVYNETIRDLLNPAGEAAELQIRQDINTGVHVPGCTRVVASTAKAVWETMEQGQRNRAQALTKMNSESSRSHSVFMVEVEVVDKQMESRVSQGKLVLVDLAGSERLSKSGVSGERQKEARFINMSLSALGDVICALGAKSSHVPFRNSKLTYLLQDSMSKQNKVMMIVQTAPTTYNSQESLCTLGFGARARAVELGRAEAKVQAVTTAEASSIVVQRTQAAQQASKQQVELIKQKVQLEQKVLALERALEEAEAKSLRAEKLISTKEEYAMKIEKERDEAVSRVHVMASAQSRPREPQDVETKVSDSNRLGQPKNILATRQQNIVQQDTLAASKRQMERQKALAQVKAKQEEKEKAAQEARAQLQSALYQPRKRGIDNNVGPSERSVTFAEGPLDFSKTLRSSANDENKLANMKILARPSVSGRNSNVTVAPGRSIQSSRVDVPATPFASLGSGRVMGSLRSSSAMTSNNGGPLSAMSRSVDLPTPPPLAFPPSATKPHASTSSLSYQSSGPFAFANLAARPSMMSATSDNQAGDLTGLRRIGGSGPMRVALVQPQSNQGVILRRF